MRSGVDVVMFSGDKLFGGPQAGILVGKQDAVRELRANPMYRALRLDKVGLAGLERTLSLYLEGRADEVPARRALLADSAAIADHARELAARLDAHPDLEARVATDGSQPGSGSAPGVLLETSVVRLASRSLATETLAERLRVGEPPVFARIQDDELVFDLRALLPDELGELEAAVRAAVEGESPARRSTPA